MTNADKIRAMTDGELAEELFNLIDCCACLVANRCTGPGNCEETWLDWLKQEVKDGKE